MKSMKVKKRKVKWKKAIERKAKEEREKYEDAKGYSFQRTFAGFFKDKITSPRHLHKCAASLKGIVVYEWPIQISIRIIFISIRAFKFEYSGSRIFFRSHRNMCSKTLEVEVSRMFSIRDKSNIRKRMFRIRDKSNIRKFPEKSIPKLCSVLYIVVMSDSSIQIGIRIVFVWIWKLNLNTRRLHFWMWSNSCTP